VNCRFLYLVGQLRAGGLERQLYFLLQRMDRERYRPEVAVWNLRDDDTYAPRIRNLGVVLHSFPDATSGAAKVGALRRIVAQTKPEVVHSYSFYTNFAAWWATLGTKAAVIGAVQSDFIRDKKGSGPVLGRLSALWPRDQIFNSVVAAENARRSRSLFVPGRRFVVRNGLDLQLFRSVPSSIDGQASVLGIGSLLPVKRWDRLLKAASELKKRGVGCLVQIAGDGPLRESLEQQARDLGVTDRVKFIGHTDSVPDLLGSATFLAHTSETEGTPNVVMEAMACRRAVVATDAGDAPSMIDDGKTGFVVRRGDDAALVDRMATLIADRELCRRMGEAGRVKAEREFGVDRLVSETLAVYRSAGWKDS
jgi:glycosyltransferase involved in cell wall biosynthesis